MVKNYILIVLFLVNTFIISAQNHLNENFDTATFPPEGWIVKDNGGGESWSQKGNEAFANAGSSTIEDDWLITPQLNLVENSVLRFKAKVDEMVPPDNLFVKVATLGNMTSDFTRELMAIRVGENVTKGFQTYVVDLKEFTGQQVYIGFHHQTAFAYTDVYGDSYNGASGFYIDDVVVTSVLTSDIEMKALQAPHNGSLVGNKKIRVLLKNTGDIDIPADQINVSYIVDNGSNIAETVGVALKVGATLEYEFVNMVDMREGVHTIQLVATMNGDSSEGNNAKEYTLVFNNDKSLVEDFSGIDFLPVGWISYFVKGAYADRLRRDGNTVFIKGTSLTEGNDILVTPKIVVEDNYVIKFSMKAPDYLQFYADNPTLIAKDELQIKISEGGNQKDDFTVLETINLKEHYEAGSYDDVSYKDFSVNLSAYVGKKIYIAFDYANQDGFGISIDNVEVGKQSTLSIKDIHNNDALVAIYPNPTTNYIRIKNVEKGEVSLFTLNGKKMMVQHISKSKNMIITENLPVGSYLLKINQGSTTSFKKIVKK
ncbi:choice-of-anchor J domain-containing protein [Tenacibaculum maritimum]|uniref:T9SS-dependent choice-of-anchor J family protein n=1 Tax=Tenacibaculum maritimum TaxID=107401 RepID=UPI0012E6CE17|nr:choice-of-anchor J domain-containing protein [Tenacibaculum maritimum]CAA0171568.1 hypothetical protein DPIF89300162_160035 [Tenacibaculum maritimum]